MPDPTEPRLLADQLDLLQKLEKRARFDLDVRGFIAIMTLVFFFAFAIVQFVMTRMVKLPAELVAPVTLILTFYFASKANGNGG